MRTFILLLSAVFAVSAAQPTITRIQLVPLSNYVATVNARAGRAESTNAAQASAINLANATNATQAADIAAQIILNAQQELTLAALGSRMDTVESGIKSKQHGSFVLTNIVLLGTTNLIFGTNLLAITNGGTITIHGTASGGGGGTTNTLGTNNIQVLGVVTNLLAETINTDFLNAGVFIPTNTVYVAITNTTIGNATNFVVDFSYSEQVITVAGAINFVHGTNLWGGSTNDYAGLSLINFSGANQTLSIPAAWKESLTFPSVITNGTIIKLAFQNYGGLSQSNIIVGAAQFQ